MNRFAILFSILNLGLSLNAQTVTSISIYFQTDHAEAEQAEVDRLLTAVKDLDCGSCSCVISGHTDSDGSDPYNRKLSESRARFVANLLKATGCANVTDTLAFGASRPVNNNLNHEEKAKNRRVEVAFSCQADIVQTEYQDVWSDFAQIQPEKHQIQCGTKEWEDGISFQTMDGVKLVIDPKTFGQQPEDLTIEFYTATDYQTAFLHGFTTMTRERLLETAGMFRVVAKRNDEVVEPVKRNGIHIYIPTGATTEKDYGPFAALEQGRYTIWESMISDGKNEFTPRNSFSDGDAIFGGGFSRCRFFFCKIRYFFGGEFRIAFSRNLVNQVMMDQEMMKTYDLFEDQLKDRFESKEAFAAFISKNDRETVLKELNRLIPNFQDLSYYVLSPPNSRWINCDRFSNTQKLTTVRVDEDYHVKKDIRLFFKGIRSIMAATSDRNGQVVFQNVPVGRVVTLIIVKKVSDQLFLSRETFRIGETPKVSFKKIDLADLRAVFSDDQN